MTATNPHPPGAIDPRRWPDVARVPDSRLRTAVARLIAARAVPAVGIRLHVGQEAPPAELAEGGAPVLWLRDPDAFHARLAHDGLIGFGESYMAGEWDSPDPVAVLTRFAEHYEELVPKPLQPLRHLTLPRRPSSDRNTRAGARRHISHHYDLSNDLFALFLDRTMTYSSALFTDDDPRDADGLARAQARKTDRLLDAAGVGEGTRLLEIGTGWGELAVRAARRGAHVTSLTLSTEQRDLARERVAAEGLSDRVSVELCDYRDATGTHDAVVSCEMVEAVGERYWPDYFAALDRLVRPGGRVALQTITMEHRLMRASRGSYTWMHKYVFPGGLIPSVTAIREQLAARTGLRITDRLAFGRDYADTLRVWRETFAGAAEQVRSLGFDDTFRHMWTFYLAYCEAGFRSGLIDVEQITMERAA
ncbi:cyclopropane-fatty-acyl-phospholipid synthase family protein [Nocardiopsis sp. B62]|uniref:SAM-dependent methyltransferase n=1 Tax=Nocardiopsis sp. B62 TaxID=2824874 RepID=UPI001B389879|nr:cyclopropane-fatty-acyl-phospholipid synthase family protein [Nocardiopsis sp. B62]MBQ1082820.1 class I SAM-dependent methyltransferase [Nocardiopsis sp. B62]